MEELRNVPAAVFILIAMALFAQATWIYLDAEKRGTNKWLWGFFGLLNVPSNLIIYLIVTRLFMKSSLCPVCGRQIQRGWRYCPGCGAVLDQRETESPE